eukprot:196796-Amphidinium_carterae.1
MVISTLAIASGWWREIAGECWLGSVCLLEQRLLKHSRLVKVVDLRWRPRYLGIRGVVRGWVTSWMASWLEKKSCRAQGLVKQPRLIL